MNTEAAQNEATDPAEGRTRAGDADTLALPQAPRKLQGQLARGGAVAWSEPLTIRTYEADKPSEYPMYLDHRVYQGSSGKVYPIPFTEGIAGRAVNRDWEAVHLENSLVRLVVLPGLGGRIHIGFDKTTGYDFFYRNNVIKPALVGLAGPWVSGGVEFNWPQHHRPSTYLPVESLIENADDGSVTVWCHDHDPFARMSAQHGVRLRPDSSVVEVVVRLHNRTTEKQTFLWWANVAARVHDQYQSFFPEDVKYVADHARRALTAFPAADRPYYGVDYPARAETTPGADRLDWYQNIPVPTSYMIVDSKQDFFGGYDHAAGAGFVHWAERRVSPGKKQWTWGNAPFGHAWDRQLTDSDGPYVELMAGVFTDNQPDFSWILPGETKVFTQYWYPIPSIGVAHQATPDAAVHVERGGRLAALFAVTRPQAAVQMRILREGDVIASRTVDMVPGVPAGIECDEHVDSAIAIELLDRSGKLLVKWAPSVALENEPWTADEPPPPHAIETVEELYLTGLHLSQYRHPTRSPLGYWNAALELDPGDIRTNLALADRDYRAGKYEAALRRINTALARLTRRNANPADAEAFYMLGLTLQRLGRVAEAEEAFGKAGWDGTWAAAAGFALAQSLSRREKNRAALRVLDTLDDVVGHDTRRLALRAVILRRMGDEASARQVIATALDADPLDATLRVLAGHDVNGDAGLLLDIALDLRDAGAVGIAINVLERAIETPVSGVGNFRPICHYVAAAMLDQLGHQVKATEHRAAARASDLTWAFPYGLDALDALECTIALEPNDAVAHFLLGMLLYAHGRRREAHSCWGRAVELGLVNKVLYRNAALAAYNVMHDDAKAWELYELAVGLAPEDARLHYELDQLAARLGHAANQRLARLRPIEQLVFSRDDFTIEYIKLLLVEGEAEAALAILLGRQFRPWEGGEGQAIAAWDAVQEAMGASPSDPPITLGEARSPYTPPQAKREDGVTDYFATSLPELLLFSRESPDD